MKWWIKYDRATGKTSRRKREKTMVRDLSKSIVWLQEEDGARPNYDPATEKIGWSQAPSADISDLANPVPENVTFRKTYIAITLTQDELNSRKNRELASTDKGLVRMIDTLMEQVATGQVLNWDSFPAQAWVKINKRRALRGLPPLTKPAP